MRHDAGQQDGGGTHGAGDGEKQPTAVAVALHFRSDQQLVSPDDKSRAHQEMQYDSQAKITQGEFGQGYQSDGAESPVGGFEQKQIRRKKDWQQPWSAFAVKGHAMPAADSRLDGEHARREQKAEKESEQFYALEIMHPSSYSFGHESVVRVGL